MDPKWIGLGNELGLGRALASPIWWVEHDSYYSVNQGCQRYPTIQGFDGFNPKKKKKHRNLGPKSTVPDLLDSDQDLDTTKIKVRSRSGDVKLV